MLLHEHDPASRLPLAAEASSRNLAFALFDILSLQYFALKGQSLALYKEGVQVADVVPQHVLFLLFVCLCACSAQTY